MRILLDKIADLIGARGILFTLVKNGGCCWRSSVEIHNKCSAAQVKAVDDFWSIYKATIFSAEQMIVGIEASRFVESTVER